MFDPGSAGHPEVVSLLRSGALGMNCQALIITSANASEICTLAFHVSAQLLAVERIHRNPSVPLLACKQCGGASHGLPNRPSSISTGVRVTTLLASKQWHVQRTQAGPRWRVQNLRFMGKQRLAVGDIFVPLTWDSVDVGCCALSRRELGD